jgi:asparagine synthase (glutamine-hydrolysing)
VCGVFFEQRSSALTQTAPSRSLGDFLVVMGSAAALGAVRRALDSGSRAAFRPGPFRSLEARGVLAAAWGGAAILETGPGAGVVALLTGPRLGDGSAAALARLAAALREDRLAAEGHDGFALAAWDEASARVWAAVDRFRSRSLHHFSGDGVFACASDLRLLLASGLCPRRVDVEALYHYLNFSCVPTPFALIRGVRKLPPASRLSCAGGPPTVARYWEIRYPEDLDGPIEPLAGTLRERIKDAIERHRPAEGQAWGCFLSGGTDSSSVAGVLARQRPEVPVRCFSIGFEDPGYDELDYVATAARHFSLDSHAARVGPDQAQAAIPVLLAAFDEPFGNSSALATYACAALAREAGVEQLLAGDGGDEIFGGNERYRKDRILGWYHGLPRPVRGLGGLLARLLAPFDYRLLNRVVNFVERGSVPNPERFYTDDAFASEQFATLLAPELRAQLRRAASLELLRDHYAAAQAPSEIHRLMYVDLRMAISDNDLVKVTRASAAAGVHVTFPLLDAQLVEFTGRLRGEHMVRALEKRYLFKRAMAGVLPREILEKKKHGFGVPVAVWLRSQPRFRDWVRETLLSKRSVERGFFAPGQVEALLERHLRGAWDHGGEIYLLLMLELWLQAHVD